MPEVIVQAAYMSGDMFGVAAALKLTPDLCVLVAYDTKDEGNAKKMLQLYKTSVGPSGVTRVAEKRVTDSRDFYKSIHDPRHPSAATNKAAVESCFPGVVPLDFKAMGRSTALVAKSFQSNKNKAWKDLYEQWKLEDFDQLGLQHYLGGKGILQNGKYLFLWVRLSGKQGGAHTELDSSRSAWQDIVNALPEAITPVLIGDRFHTAITRPGKPLVDMTNFWRDFFFDRYSKNPKFVGAEQRRAQFALFDYLLNANYQHCHLGMRSGVLESVALMGCPVVYMEEHNNPQQRRIEQLAKSMSNFERFELQALPTRRGKVVADHNEKDYWKTKVGPCVRALAFHCREDFKDIAWRISLVEKQVNLGAPFDTYYTAFVNLCIPVWTPKYPAVSYWTQYTRDHAGWCDRLRGFVKAVYDVTWSKQGYDKGFAAVDLNNIITLVKTKLGA
jgi:hypothetical protein